MTGTSGFVGILDVVKGLLGDAEHEKPQPSVAAITIISSDAVPATGESQSDPASS